MLQEQKCPNCGGALIFDPALGKMRCEFCDSIFEIQQIQQPQQMQVNRNERDQAMQQMAPLPIYVCRSCGAEVVTPAQTTGSLTCPYCGNNIVLTQQFTGMLKPDGIVPFSIMPNKLAESVQNYYKGKRFLPRGFFSSNKIGPVTGVYVPFWVFDCDVYGDITFRGEKMGKTYKEGDYQCTEYESYQINRNVSMSFHDLALDASKRMENDLMDSIQPYDLSKIMPFDVRYLAGFVADRFDEASSESRKRSDARMKKTGAKVAMQRATQGYGSVTISSERLAVNMRQARYVLLPVYLLNLSFEGKDYHFAVNGQTGKVEGKLPYSKTEEKRFYWKWFAAGASAVAAAIALIVLL